MSTDDDDPKSARQIAREKQREAGDRSTRLANVLMKLSAPAVKKLELDEDLRDAMDRARAVTSHVARRRAERTLAGDLRRFDLDELEAQLARMRDGGNTDAPQLHVAERWRARMIDEGLAAAASFPGGAGEPLPRLIAAAQRQRATGRPPGAARALFRHIVEALNAPRPKGDSDGDSDGDGGSDDDDDDDV
jgi:ribosome-associated protein